MFPVTWPEKIRSEFEEKNRNFVTALVVRPTVRVNTESDQKVPKCDFG